MDEKEREKAKKEAVAREMARITAELNQKQEEAERERARAILIANLQKESAIKQVRQETAETIKQLEEAHLRAEEELKRAEEAASPFHTSYDAFQTTGKKPWED